MFEKTSLEALIDVSENRKCIVGYFANDNLLDTDIPGSDIAKKANEFLPEKYHINGTPAGFPYTKGQYFIIAAINSALDTLGIKNIRTATHEEVIGVIRKKDFPDKDNNCNYFALVLQDTDGISYEHAQDLFQQLRELNIIYEMGLPLLLTGLRASRDDSFKEGVRLDFDINHSKIEDTKKLLDIYTSKGLKNGSRTENLIKMLTTPQPQGGLRSLFLATDNYLEITHKELGEEQLGRVLISRDYP